MADTCGTCGHYSGEGCAIDRETPMQHRACPPDWSCPEYLSTHAELVHPPDCLCDPCVRAREAAWRQGKTRREQKLYPFDPLAPAEKL